MTDSDLIPEYYGMFTEFLWKPIGKSISISSKKFIINKKKINVHIDFFLFIIKFFDEIEIKLTFFFF